MVDPQGPSAVGGAPLFGGLNTTVSGSMTKQKPLLFPSVPNAPAYLRRMPTKAEVPADLIVVHNSVRGKPRLGSNGFRAWLARPAARYVRCDCKWAAHLAVHYRVEQDGS